MTELLSYRGKLSGHKDWVTHVTTSSQPNILVSSSRDKSLLVWNIKPCGNTYALPIKSLRGHSHFVNDVVMSSDGQFAISGSWDKTLRLWDLQTGQTTRRFVGHTGDVLSVAFSVDNRQIVSASRDGTARLWNTLAQCKYKFTDDDQDWVSCAQFSPNTDKPIVVTCGWDKLVKVWNLKNCSLRNVHHGHTGFLNTVTVSPDGSLCASGGKDGQAMLWDLTSNKFLYTLSAGSMINALCFSPSRYWLCAAVGPVIKVWDLEHKLLAEEIVPELEGDRKKELPHCTCLTWSADGQTLFAGYTDGFIRVWQIMV